MLELSGAREAALDGGASVPLYLADGRIDAGYSSIVPACVTHRVGDAVTSEWAYCTDHSRTSCIVTYMDPPTPITGNPRFLASFDPLGPEKERVIASLAADGYPLRNGSGLAFANDDTTESRRALQNLIWCVSDAGVGVKTGSGSFCGSNFSAADYDAVLARIPGDPKLEIAAPTTDGIVGEATRFTVTTNLVGQAITVTTSGDATWTVCDGDATLAGGTLTVNSGSASSDQVITLCAAGDGAGSIAVEATITPRAGRDLVWAWNGDANCQVFATHVPARVQTLNAAATATVRAAPTTPTTPTEPTTPTTPSGPSTVTTPITSPATVTKLSTLRLTKTSAGSSFKPGQAITYRIRVSNPSSAVVRNVRVCDTMPRGLVFVSASPKAQLRNGQNCWTVKSLGAKKSASFRLVARVSGNAPARVTNRVSASSADVAKTAVAKRTVRIKRAVAKAGGVTG